MTSNRLIDRAAQHDQPVGPRFANKSEEAAHHNQRLAERGRDDVEWIVADGSLRLVDREDWSRRRRKQIEEKREEERRRFNWRLLHPITDGEEAARL